MTRNLNHINKFKIIKILGILSRVIPCHCVSFCVIACHCVSFRVIACHFVSFYMCHFVSLRVISCHSISLPVPCHSCCKWCSNAGIFTGLFADRRSIHVTCQQPETNPPCASIAMDCIVCTQHTMQLIFCSEHMWL
jgi:hypothetical protein